MALKSNHFLFVSVMLLSCTAMTIGYNMQLCTNVSVSCSAQFLQNTTASVNDCRLVAYQGSECLNRTFVTRTSSRFLGTMRLRVYPFSNEEDYPAFNISLTDIKWTVFRFRFKLLGDNFGFCREFHRSPKYHIEEIFYDCLSSPSKLPGRSFKFEYQAEDENNNIEVRQFIHVLPIYRNIENGVPLQSYTPFLYVDITDLPALTARWQQAPFHGLKYSVEIYKVDKKSGNTLEHSAVIDGEVDSNKELSYKYNVFPSSGIFRVEVRVLSENCAHGLCNVSISPEFQIDEVFAKTLLVGVVGFVVLLPVVLFIVLMWRRQCRPPSTDVRLPTVLIIHTPSRASHLKCVIALTEYLKNHCFIEALLDQLDVQHTESKDPWTWCNDAFARADFVMVVSSPPKCCNEEGIFRNMDLVALRFLKEKFSSGSSKPHFFSVLLPYCTKEDIPDEARNLRVFKLMKEFDQMLWYIHNDGKLPSVVDSAHMLLGPRPQGGKSELNTKGKILLTALKEAEFDREKVCSCANKVKGSDNDIEDESEGFIQPVNPSRSEYETDLEKERFMRSISDSGSTSCLLRKSSNDLEEINIEFSDSTNMFPRLTDLDLLQENVLPSVSVNTGDTAKPSSFNVHTLSL